MPQGGSSSNDLSIYGLIDRLPIMMPQILEFTIIILRTDYLVQTLFTTDTPRWS